MADNYDSDGDDDDDGGDDDGDDDDDDGCGGCCCCCRWRESTSQLRRIQIDVFASRQEFRALKMASARVTMIFVSLVHATRSII